MPQRFPPGKGNRQQRDVRAKGASGKQKKDQNRTGRSRMTSERTVSPSTWNIAGSSRVYFCQLKRLPGALCDTWLLCCLTRKEKRERGEGRRVGLGPFPLSRVCFPPQGWRIFRSRDVMKLWEAYGGNSGFYRCVCVCLCVCECRRSYVSLITGIYFIHTIFFFFCAFYFYPPLFLIFLPPTKNFFQLWLLRKWYK